jgi:Methyltransferase domain
MIDWTRIPGHFTFSDLYEWAAKEPTWGDYVEVGVLHGQSAAFLASELALYGAHSHDVGLDLVDTFPNGTEELARRLAGVKHIVRAIHAGISWDVAAKYTDESLDFVYIDADHAYESVRRDIAAWWPKVRRGGALAGHDYTPEIPGVIQAVTEAFERVEVWRGERFLGPTRQDAPGNYYPSWMVRK